jgi:hypothetical protein
MHADPTTSARIELLDAILLGIERRAEILALVEVAADYSTAQAEVCSLLGLPPNLADAVLDLQVDRLVTYRARIDRFWRLWPSNARAEHLSELALVS